MDEGITKFSWLTNSHQNLKYFSGDKVSVPDATGKYTEEIEFDYRLFKFSSLFAQSTDVVNRKILEPSFEAIVDAGTLLKIYLILKVIIVPLRTKFYYMFTIEVSFSQYQLSFGRRYMQKISTYCTELHA